MSDRNCGPQKQNIKILGQQLSTKSKIQSTPSKIPRTASKIKPSPKILKNEKPSNQTYSISKSVKKKRFPRRPVDYTWNRGGRLKEIRIRTQARKFLHLWIRKTFGRVTLSKADAFHKKSILKRSYKAWREDWWENCGEWKLMVRSQFFHRFQTYSKVWKTWRDYVQCKKERNLKLKAALDLYKLKAFKKYVYCWKVYVQLRVMKVAMYERSYNIARSNRIRRTWITWRREQLMKREEKSNSQIALQRFNAVVQDKCWKAWRNYYEQRKATNKQTGIAANHSRINLLHHCFNIWCRYTTQRQHKISKTRKAQNLYEFSLKGRTLLQWRIRYNTSIQWQATLDACNELSIQVVKRRYFIRWTQYIADISTEHRKMAIADLYRRCKLKRFAMKAMISMVELRHYKLEQLYRSQKFRENQLLRTTWTKWGMRLEEIEEQDLSDLSQIARRHHRIALKKKCLRQLQDHAIKSKLQRTQRTKAQVHFIVKTLPKCFKSWRTFVENVKEQKALKQKASDFNKEVLETKYFYVWWKRFDQTRELRTMERMALMHHGETVLRQHFHTWLSKTRAILSANHSDVLARIHYRRALLHTAIISWKKFYKISMERQRKIMYAESYYRTGNMAGVWLSWVRYVEHRRNKRTKILEARSKYSTKIITKCFTHWKTYIGMTRRIEANATVRYQAKNFKILRQHFQEWRLGTLEKRKDKTANEKALCHRNNQLKSMIFSRWKKWSTVHSYRRTQTHEKIESTIKRLNQISRAGHFQHWVSLTRESKATRLKVKMAEDFYERKVCKVVFQAWLLYRFLGLKKSLMQRQADVFSENRILKNSLTLWMHSLRESVEQKRKTGDALWFWSVTLQMRCFESWKAYTLERLRKKRRFTQALEIRTQNMLTHGCTQILRYHSDKLATRSKMASRLQALSNHTQQHLAWKYGTRWLHKTRHRKEERKFHTIRSWSPDPPTDVWMNVAPTPPVLVATSPEPKIRAAPRLPDFLDESLNREGLLLGKYSTYRITDDGNESADLNLLKKNADSQSTLQSRQLLEPNSQILLPPSAFTLNHENLDCENDHHHENANAAENLHDINTNLYPGWKGHDNDNFCENRIVVHENVHEEQGTHHGDHELDHACKLLHTQQHIPNKFYHPHKKGNKFHHGYDNEVHGMLSHDTFSGYHHGDHGPEKWVKSRKISRDSIGNSGDGIHDTSSSNSSTHDVSRTPEFPYEPTTQLHSTSQTFIVTSQCDDPSLTYIASRDDTSYGSSSQDSSKTFIKFSPRGVHRDNSPFMKFHETSCDTSKTFIKQASPKQSRDSVHEELKSIHKELQEFQSLKQQLRILKQQQSVMLESYERNTMNMLPSTSLDFNVVENELKQISSEIDGISKTLISRKPEIENLALRVRVLSSRPSC